MTHPDAGAFRVAGIILSRLAVATVVLCLACSREPAAPASPAIRYDVWIPSTGTDSLHLRMTVDRWDGGDSVRILLPPVYADNPLLTSAMPLVRNLQVSDGDGAAAGFSGDSVPVGNFRSFAVSCVATWLPVSVEYDVVFSFVDSLSGGMAVPRLDENGGFLQGTYLFAVPCLSTDLVRLWRDPWDAEVVWHPAAGLELLGDPQPRTRAANAYELLFTMSAVVRSEEATAHLLHIGEGGGQAFRIVSVADTPVAGVGLLAGVSADCATLLGDICAVFGRLREAPVTVILGSGMSGGLEGMFAYAILDPPADDTAGVFNMVAAHETAHFWVGVRTGDLDLPWWKEGTTTYLGFLFAARNGLCSRQAVEERLLQDLDSLQAVREHALSDPAVRADIYTPGFGYYDLVYVKGGQVTMLLDRAVRDASGGAVSIDKVVASLCGTHRSTTVTRQEYIDEIRRLSGADAGDILARYGETTGGIPDSVLLDNYGALAAAGAFGPAPLDGSPRMRTYDPARILPFAPGMRSPLRN